MFILSAGFCATSLYFDWRTIEIISSIPTLVFGIRVILFVASWIIWLFMFNIFSSEAKTEIKKYWKYGLLVMALPTVFYLLQGWTGHSFVGGSYSNYPGILLFRDVIQHLILPGLTLGMLLSGIIARLVRSNMISTLNDQYIDASRSRGIKENKTIQRKTSRR